MVNDLKWAARRLTRRIGFSSVFVAILGATLGMTLTIGTVARATIGAALPFDDEGALYALSESNAEQEIDRLESSWASVLDWQERGRAFETLGAVRSQLNLTMDLTDGVIRVGGAVVSRSMFQTLLVHPVIGRPFSPEEDAPGAGIASVILSFEAWRDRFGEDPAILDRSVVLNGRTWSVVGVLPDNRTLAPQAREPIDVWLPMGMAGEIDGPPVYTSRLYRIFSVIGRLRKDATPLDLDRDLTSVTAGLAADHPEYSGGWTWGAQPLRERVLAGVATPMAALLIGGILLLVVAVANLLALYIQRVRAEQDEMTTRIAVGAQSSDLVRLSLVELALLGVVSGVLATLVSAVALALLPHWLPIDLPTHVRVGFSGIQALVGVGGAAGALVLVGLVGMSVALRGLERSAASGGRVVGPPAGPARVSRASLVAQIALSTFLAIGSTIAVRSFAQLSRSDPGIDPDRLTALRVDVPAELRDGSDVGTTADEIERSIELLPGVERAFVWAPHVPTEATWYTRVRLFDRPDVPESELPTVRINTVGAGAVSDLGLMIVAGRDLTELDRSAGRRVLLISASAARAWWGSEAAAVGKIMKRWSHDDWSEVVGVVEDAPLSGRRGQGSDFFTDVYFLFGQDPQRNLVFLARARPGMSPGAEELRISVRRAAPDLPAYDIRTMTDRLADQDSVARSSALLSMLFAMTAVLLAALGLYGALSFAVNRKRREIGLRQALGASPARIARELFSNGTGVVVVGALGGVLLAWWGLLPMGSALFGVGPRDVTSYATATALLLTTSFVALGVPAWRALRLSPGASLRAD